VTDLFGQLKHFSGSSHFGLSCPKGFLAIFREFRLSSGNAIPPLYSTLPSKGEYIMLTFLLIGATVAALLAPGVVPGFGG